MRITRVNNGLTRVSLAAIWAAMLVGSPAHALEPIGYLGPGAGLTTIGALLAVLAMLFLALLGPILYPIRLLRRRWKKHNLASSEGENTPEP